MCASPQSHAAPHDSEEFRHRAATVYSAGVEHMFFWIVQGGQGAPTVVICGTHCDGSDIGTRSMRGGRQVSQTCRARAWNLRKLGDWDLSYVTPG